MLAQKDAELEVLIVDGGQAPAEMVDSLARRDARISVVRTEGGGVAEARNAGLERARGELIAVVGAADRLHPEHAATMVELFSRFADVSAFAPACRLLDEPGGAVRGLLGPLPFDLPLALLANRFGGGGSMFRASVFREHGLRYDPAVDPYSDWALWLDCARAGLRVEVVPRALCDECLPRGGITADLSWGEHAALLGLLVERHLPPGDDAEHRQLLVTLLQGWSSGDPGSMLPAALRYRLADAVARQAERIPVLSRSLQWLLTGAMRVHGRWKDRKSNRRVPGDSPRS